MRSEMAVVPGEFNTQEEITAPWQRCMGSLVLAEQWQIFSIVFAPKTNMTVQLLFHMFICSAKWQLWFDCGHSIFAPTLFALRN